LDRKEEILRAAFEVFKKYGFAKATMEDVAYQCGIKKTALYYYFKNKEDLFKTVFRNDIYSLKISLTKEIEKQTNPPDKIKTYMLKRLQSFREKKIYFDIFKKENLPIKHCEFIKDLRKEFLNFEYNTISEFIQEGINSGIYDVKSIESLIYMIMGATYGFGYTIFAFDRGINFREKIDNILDIILKGIEQR